MKKSALFILALVLLVSLCGCGTYSQSDLDAAYAEGYDKGYNAGYDRGYESGYSDSFESDVDVSNIKPIDYFWFAYCIVDDYLTGESTSIEISEVYQLIEEGFQKFYAASEIDPSDSWQKQERNIDLQDSIEPIKSAMAELEEYLMGDADSVNLIEVHDYLAQGLLNYQDVN